MLFKVNHYIIPRKVYQMIFLRSMLTLVTSPHTYVRTVHMQLTLLHFKESHDVRLLQPLLSAPPPCVSLVLP